MRKTNPSSKGFDSSTFSDRKKVIAKEEIHYPAPKFLQVATGQTYLKAECDLSHYMGNRQCKEAKVTTTPKGM